ncbi:MAG: hypothetical protein MI700_05340 [Balneolales bacterium]|nr:hypothetical protein [Balneolales bacterium]
MKKLTKFASLLGVALVLTISLTHQDIKAQEIEVSTGVDLYSTYVFRGIAFSGPSWQPYVEASSGGFAIGAWGSQGYDGFQEMDLYAGYSFDFGLSLGVTDYYYPGSPYGDGESHAIEINAGFEIDALSIAANFIPEEATNAGAAGEDMYFELGYAFDKASLFVGAGDGWHSSDGDFALVNVGVSTGKDIVVTESLTIPLSGAAIYNPDTEQFYILVGFSF